MTKLLIEGYAPLPGAGGPGAPPPTLPQALSSICRPEAPGDALEARLARLEVAMGLRPPGGITPEQSALLALHDRLHKVETDIAAIRSRRQQA